ncbi:hypothetical protein Taro_040888 [Colocasia esculenta]|uniref:Uncharacterized protein n=1 Tax=Colocasia esculenta TaxID=4460 RepID=A0A843WA31_COLES|nr:hypothetical protein [Colocasia esculenta]
MADRPVSIVGPASLGESTSMLMAKQGLTPLLLQPCNDQEDVNVGPYWMIMPLDDKEASSQEDGDGSGKARLDTEDVKDLLKEVESLCTDQAREVAKKVGISFSATEEDLKGAFSKINK